MDKTRAEKEVSRFFPDQFCENLAAALNADPHFRRWARGMNFAVAFACGEERAALSFSCGAARACGPENPALVLSGGVENWRRALAGPWSAGYYDVTETAGLLTAEGPPVLAAANAKALCRLWKRLRALYNGEERSWDGHV